MNKAKAILVGAGQRGTFVYGRYALEHKEQLQFVAVVEPDRFRRLRFAADHGLSPDSCFENFEVLKGGSIDADAVVVATMDRLHTSPAIMAMEAGYDVLLEKPMAVTASECKLLVDTARRTDKLLFIAHVLRYTSFFSTLKEIISTGRLGDIISIEHFENVSYWHMAHSFVRGNWSDSSTSGPMILSKCCHDLDLLVWMMSHTRPVSVSSRGSLSHFRRSKAPPGATDRCTDDCPAEQECPFFAPRFYLDMERDPYFAHAITDDISPEGRLRALREGPYGRCVYKTDNDVVDHQSVLIEFADQSIATLIMHGLSQDEGRTMRYDGSRATLRGAFPHYKPHEIEIQDHLSNASEHIEITPSGWGGHGGGDGGIINAFLQSLAGQTDRKVDLCSAETALTSHILAFAAEEARLSGNTINLDQFYQSLLTG